MRSPCGLRRRFCHDQSPPPEEQRGAPGDRQAAAVPAVALAAGRPDLQAPGDVEEASERITELQRALRRGAATVAFERRLEAAPVAAGYAAGYRDDEISGYGASASWR